MTRQTGRYGFWLTLVELENGVFYAGPTERRKNNLRATMYLQEIEGSQEGSSSWIPSHPVSRIYESDSRLYAWMPDYGVHIRYSHLILDYRLTLVGYHGRGGPGPMGRPVDDSWVSPVGAYAEEHAVDYYYSQYTSMSGGSNLLGPSLSAS